MKDTTGTDDTKVLGDITPEPKRKIRREADAIDSVDTDFDEDVEGGSATSGGSQHDRTKHSGSRDVTEGTTGGAGTETGGTRNYRSGSGHVGGDIGNRPE